MHGVNYAFIFRGESVSANDTRTYHWGGGHGVLIMEAIGGETLEVHLRYAPDATPEFGSDFPFPGPNQGVFIGTDAVQTLEFALPPGNVTVTVKPNGETASPVRVGIFEVNQRSVV